ncbi:MAG: polysaccharide deacetylase family protein [Clostridia bacterium]|nr:polysaccharide deacetylase family protein [Clostridia bacterium]
MRWVKQALRLLGCALLCAVLLCGSALHSFAEARVVYHSASGDGHPRIALTFDDGPHPKYTPQILDILAEYGIPATFFAVGENVAAYPEIVARICREGHELGDHTYHHRRVSKMDEDALRQEILACKDAIREQTGVAPRLFRPPEGVCDPTLKRICEELDMTIILWSVDTRDWAHTPQRDMIENVRSNTKNGSIILMHDFIGQKSPTPAALKRIIPMLLELGYEFVTVSQLLEAEAA